MAAGNNLGRQFHVEDDMLHVGGKPFRLAMPSTFSPDTGLRTWRIPFESGHEMVVGGSFDERGENKPVLGERSVGLIAAASHKPTGTDYAFKGTEKAPLGGDLWDNPEGGTSSNRTWVHIPTANVFHRRVREVSELEGGGRSGR